MNENDIDTWAEEKGYERHTTETGHVHWQKPTVRQKLRCDVCFRKVLECDCDEIWGDL